MKEAILKLKRRSSNNNLMAISVGIVYLWFGALKFFPHLSPAEGLATDTIHQLTFGFIPVRLSIFLLALWETGIGLLLIGNLFRRTVVILALVHMVFTFSPLFLSFDLTFYGAPFSLTLLGQYIIKNIIIVSVLITLLKDTGKPSYSSQ